MGDAEPTRPRESAPEAAAALADPEGSGLARVPFDAMCRVTEGLGWARASDLRWREEPGGAEVAVREYRRDGQCVHVPEVGGSRPADRVAYWAFVLGFRSGLAPARVLALAMERPGDLCPASASSEEGRR